MTIAQKAEDFVFNLFKDKLSSAYIYHNFNHTSRVVNAAKAIISSEENISEEDKEIAELATWFHDTGYTEGIDNHEQKSVVIARKFLQQNNVSPDVINKVEELILVTQGCENPKNILEEIIKDADCSHFGDPNYSGVSELLRAEWKETLNKEYTDLQWAVLNRELLLNCHRYYTDFAKQNWDKIKNDNIIALQKRIQKLEASEKEKTERTELPGRGIDTMFRVTLNNHTRLSEIADSKANILLSVNAILISIVLSVLIPKLDSPKNFHLILPSFVLLMSSVTTIIFAILSTRPKITSGTFTREEVANKKVNILFFGNFFRMPLPEYQWAMNELMKDKTDLYNALSQDLYYLGLVLNRKYRLLRITYNIFMTGIIVSVIVFVWAFLKYNIGVE